MLFPAALLPKIEDGRVQVAFRRWQRPSVKAGGTLRSPVGVLAIDAVEPVRETDLTDTAARAAGYPDAEALRASLRPTGTLMRVRFHRVGEDPRVALRDEPADDDERATIEKKLAAMDARAALPWTHAVLRALREGEGVRAADLAERLAMGKDELKVRVRRLKELGLTESLDVGYRLSKRGRGLLAATKVGRSRA